MQKMFSSPRCCPLCGGGIEKKYAEGGDTLTKKRTKYYPELRLRHDLFETSMSFATLKRAEL